MEETKTTTRTCDLGCPDGAPDPCGLDCAAEPANPTPGLSGWIETHCYDCGRPNLWHPVPADG